LDGLEEHWSHLVEVPDLDGVGRTFHVLDTHAHLQKKHLDGGAAGSSTEPPEVTLLCVHGNPSWSYLWRNIIAGASEQTRVVAVDQMDMGFSERTGTARRLAQRVDDLGALTNELGLTGKVITIAHDWGGPVSLGWVMRHRHLCAGVVLTNTAVHQPEGSPAPAIIRLARIPFIRKRVCVDTPGFIQGAIRMSRPRPHQGVRDGLMAPYETPERRQAISTWVEDIPLEDDHPSAAILDDIANSLNLLGNTPALLVWGSSDPVFSDLYLHDLQQRLPHAATQRYPAASHFVHEEVDTASPILAWVRSVIRPQQRREEFGAPGDGQPVQQRSPIWNGIEHRSVTTPDVPAVIELADTPDSPVITFGEMAEDVEIVAAGLHASGVQPGQRVALMIPPGINLSACLYACWRLGAVAVLVDAALGPRGMDRAVQGANPDYLIGIPKAMAAARAFNWPGRRVSSESMPTIAARAAGVQLSLEDVRLAGSTGDIAAPTPDPGADAVVVFTSGSTGPSKGVVYKHRQLAAQRDALRAMTGLTADDRLVAAFAPFALFGPALGLPTAVPNMDVSAPGTLTAVRLAEAARSIDATVVFASPAALANVVATGSELTADDHDALARIRLVMSAGAPVHQDVLVGATALMANAQACTPYGMTELLPAANISLAELLELEKLETDDTGVCVGTSLDGVLARISPFDDPDTLTKEPGVAGEVVLRAAHAKDRYDQLWGTQYATEYPSGWHRSGDVGHLDDAGRLWIEGRMAHLISTADGIVTPVGIEQAAESLATVRQAAAVGVGPEGTEQVVVVVVPSLTPRRAALADLELLDEIRAASSVEVASVLVVPKLPTDRRHNSKIDRLAIAEWAAAILAGGRIGSLT